MKYLITLVFIGFSYLSYGQTSFYHIINKNHYDSLEIQTWYRGRIYFNNDTQRDGWIHRVPDEPIVQYKEDKKGKLISYSSRKIKGFYNIDKKDTAFFVFMDINCGVKHWKEDRSLRILITDKEGLSLLRFSWIEKKESKMGYLFKSNAYQIYWKYFLWKDGELREIFSWRKNLYSVLKENPYSKDYYKEYKRELNGDHHYLYLSNMITIYNKTKNIRMAE